MSNTTKYPVKSEDKEFVVIAGQIPLAADASVGTPVANANLYSIAKGGGSGLYTVTLKNKYVGTPRITCHIAAVATGNPVPFVGQAGLYTAHTTTAFGTIELMTLDMTGARADVNEACNLVFMAWFKDSIPA